VQGERLLALARFPDTAQDRLGFGPSFNFAFDPKTAEEHRIWRHVYLGRYMRLTPREIEEMPLSLIGRYITALSELIKKEAGPSKLAETDYV
jgi:hypothetical protein